MTESYHIPTGRSSQILEALIVHAICFPVFGVTTGLNRAPNRQPSGSNASTASSNKGTVFTAEPHSLPAFHDNISLFREKLLGHLPVAQRKGSTVWEQYFGHNEGFVSAGGEKLDKPVSL